MPFDHHDPEVDALMRDKAAGQVPACTAALDRARSDAPLPDPCADLDDPVAGLGGGYTMGYLDQMLTGMVNGMLNSPLPSWTSWPTWTDPASWNFGTVPKREPTPAETDASLRRIGLEPPPRLDTDDESVTPFLNPTTDRITIRRGATERAYRVTDMAIGPSGRIDLTITPE